MKPPSKKRKKFKMTFLRWCLSHLNVVGRRLGSCSAATRPAGAAVMAGPDPSHRLTPAPRVQHKVQRASPSHGCASYAACANYWPSQGLWVEVSQASCVGSRLLWTCSAWVWAWLGACLQSPCCGSMRGTPQWHLPSGSRKPCAPFSSFVACQGEDCFACLQLNIWCMPYECTGLAYPWSQMSILVEPLEHVSMFCNISLPHQAAKFGIKAQFFRAAPSCT